MMRAVKLSSLFSMTDEQVLVTGRSSGLGQHFAMLLVQAGTQVSMAACRVDI